MNNQPLPNPDKVTPAELRGLFRTLNERLDQIENELAEFRQGVAAVAIQPDRQVYGAGETMNFTATLLVVGYDDNGNPMYKMKGGPYMKFGVRVWPEVLPELGIDTTTLRPGPNQINLNVCALMGDKGPRKIVGLAR